MPFLVRSTNPARLAKLEAAFEHAGGRGVELADEIDALRDPMSLVVATLEEAREIALSSVLSGERAHGDPEWVGRYSELDANARELPESGGKVGPLPDGTVIEVTNVVWAWLVGVLEDRGVDLSDIEEDIEMIDLYNDDEREA